MAAVCVRSDKDEMGLPPRWGPSALPWIIPSYEDWGIGNTEELHSMSDDPEPELRLVDLQSQRRFVAVCRWENEGGGLVGHRLVKETNT